MLHTTHSTIPSDITLSFLYSNSRTTLHLYTCLSVCACVYVRVRVVCDLHPTMVTIPQWDPFLSPYISPPLCLSTCPSLLRFTDTPLSLCLCLCLCTVLLVLCCRVCIRVHGWMSYTDHRYAIAAPTCTYLNIPKSDTRCCLSAQPYYFPYTVNVYLRSHTRLFYWFPVKNKHESYRRFHSIGTVHDTIPKFKRVEWIKSTCDILPVLLCVVLIM